MSVYLRTLRDVQARAREHDAVLVAFSGGKDSLAVLDLCRRAFRRVEAFHFVFADDMDYTRERVGEPLARLGVPVRYYADPGCLAALKRGVFCDPKFEYDALRVPTDAEAYQEAASDAGIPLVATGKKKSDYRQRAFFLNAGKVFGWHPLADWRKADVLAYLKVRGITPPDSHADAGGIDLTTASLRWLKARYPGDFAKLLKWFPYAEAVVLRACGEQEETSRKQGEEEARGSGGAGTAPAPGPAADPVRRVRAGRRAAQPDQGGTLQPPADHG